MPLKEIEHLCVDTETTKRPVCVGGGGGVGGGEKKEDRFLTLSIIADC